MNILKPLNVNGKNFYYFSIFEAQSQGLGQFDKLPCSLKILLENLLRHGNQKDSTEKFIYFMNQWLINKKSKNEIPYKPARILMQDFTGVPAIVDLAAMRDALASKGCDARKINPIIPVDLVIDHSIQVDKFATKDAFEFNIKKEMARNYERYSFLRWGQKSFKNLRIIPPGNGICHQLNLEYLAKVVCSQVIENYTIIYPDTVVGTDSHTTMINGLGVLGWGVGGIEAEAAMLGQPISMIIPEVIGFEITGSLTEGITATDVVLTITQMLRQYGVVGKFVEFFGSGIEELSLADRATIANMAPEYGATCGFFPIDEETLRYLRLTGRDENQIELIKLYAKSQGFWRDDTKILEFTDTLTLDLSKVVGSISGPKRPQDRVNIKDLGKVFTKTLISLNKNTNIALDNSKVGKLNHGDVVISAITSCTNTSNPKVLIAAGLLAKKAVDKGIFCPKWVKTSFAPGSTVVPKYLKKLGLQYYLEQLGYHVIGYGCTTCIGNSGPLAENILKDIISRDLIVSAVLSGNRNFEGRIHQHVKTNWLASPPLVIAYGLLGHTRADITRVSLGNDKENNPVYLRDIWPSNIEISKAMNVLNKDMFCKQYSKVFKGNKDWRKIKVDQSDTYNWKKSSTYVQSPPFFFNLKKNFSYQLDIYDAHILALLGDSVTTDHISPAGDIQINSPAAQYLKNHNISPENFNSYGSRRGNHEVMMRGTFSNIRIRNQMVPKIEGGFTKHIPSGDVQSIYDVAMRYQSKKIPLVIIAGKEYGTGSSRDWAAKGTRLLGIKAVIAESYERIHRSNLIGMGVLPLQFKPNYNQNSLQLNGSEKISIIGLNRDLQPKQDIKVKITYENNSEKMILVNCKIDTQTEMKYYFHGGILEYVISMCS